MKEQDIRPNDLFMGLLAASRQDIPDFFPRREDDQKVGCVACGEDDSELAFVKLGFPYRTCTHCGSLFTNPRPPAEQFAAYLKGSNMGRFFGEHFYRETADQRRQLVYRPRAELVAETVRSLLGPDELSAADVGSGFGVFLTELQATGAFTRLVGVEPDPQLAALGRERGFGILESSAEEATADRLPGGAVQVATCFEVVEHVRDPLTFVSSIARLLAPGGLLYLTTLTISGFDLQVLGEHSNSIYPPHHINLMSLHGFEHLFRRAGLELVKVSTPGKLDVSIVANALRDQPELRLPPVVHSLIGKGAAFQAYLQEQNLSSHVHVVGRKP